MAVTGGYFNSVNGDRKYNADQMSEYFEGIINEGVCQHIGGGLAVTAGTGLSVVVATGKAFIGQKWLKNDAALTLTISAASESYSRIDAVVIRKNNAVRSCQIAVKVGTPAASPVAPTMTRDSTTYEMALAYVTVAAGASSVTVTDKRADSAVCGWAAVAQAASGEVDQMLNDMKTGFDGVVYNSPAEMVQGCDQVLSNAISSITGNVFYPYTHKGYYIGLSGTTADVTAYTPLEGYECCVIPCVAGDIFTITAKGQNATRPWGFVAADGTILSVASANTGYTDETITAPENTAYLVSNNWFSYPYIGCVTKNTFKGSHYNILISQNTDFRSGIFSKFNTIFMQWRSISYVQDDLPADFVSNHVGNAFLFNINYTDLFDGVKCVEQLIFNNSVNAIYYRVFVASTGEVLRSWTKLLENESPKNKWYVLGDSISAGYYSLTDAQAQAQGVTITYRPSDYGYPVYGVGSVWDATLSHNYWGYANKWFLHRQLVGKAYPGQGYFKTASNSQNGIYVVKNTDFSDAGLITVAWGFNDWHYDQPRGNHDLIDPSVKYPTEEYDTSQITTVNQAIWFCLGELIRKAPQAKIVVQTPMNGWLYGGDFDSNWGIGYAMEHSGTLENIHDDIVYWANYYGLQVMDMTFGNSVVNRLNIKDSLIDGSHPSDPAHQQLGRTVANKILYG